jgi:Acetyltransferase (GNAT) family
MKYVLLADRPEAIPTVARWYYDEWGHKAADNSFEQTCERIRGKLNRDKAPLHLLAVGSDQVLGVAQLKIREMDIYPDKEYWLGSVYTPIPFRHQGVASGLSDQVAALAKSFGIDTLFLQTERLDGGLYPQLGWKPLEKVLYKGLDVLVMEKALLGNHSDQSENLPVGKLRLS